MRPWRAFDPPPSPPGSAACATTRGRAHGHRQQGDRHVLVARSDGLTHGGVTAGRPKRGPAGRVGAHASDRATRRRTNRQAVKSRPSTRSLRDPPEVRPGRRTAHVLEPFGVNPIVARENEVGQRRRVDGRQPDGVDPQPLEVVQPSRDACQVAHAVPITVLEAARVDLVDDGVVPPGAWGRVGMGLARRRDASRLRRAANALAHDGTQCTWWGDPAGAASRPVQRSLGAGDPDRLGSGPGRPRPTSQPHVAWSMRPWRTFDPPPSAPTPANAPTGSSRSTRGATGRVSPKP